MSRYTVSLITFPSVLVREREREREREGEGETDRQTDRQRGGVKTICLLHKISDFYNPERDA